MFSQRPGRFDAIVGNPPFLGGTNISSRFGRDYLTVLSTLFQIEQADDVISSRIFCDVPPKSVIESASSLRIRSPRRYTPWWCCCTRRVGLDYSRIRDIEKMDW